MTGVRERGHPDPGCSAAPRRSGLNLTSWSSYRDFTDRTPCQADLATNSTSAAGQEDGRWAAVPGLPALTPPTARQSPGEGAGAWPETPRASEVEERRNLGSNSTITKGFVLTIFCSSSRFFLTATMSMVGGKILNECEYYW